MLHCLCKDPQALVENYDCDREALYEWLMNIISKMSLVSIKGMVKDASPSGRKQSITSFR